jgi:hypothetical protein
MTQLGQHFSLSPVSGPEWTRGAIAFTVMPREGGAPSIQGRARNFFGVSDYWIIRIRG